MLSSTYKEKTRVHRRGERKEEQQEQRDAHSHTAGRVPNLYEQFHLLVAIEAFALTNAPETCLRTSLKNMLSMTENTRAGEPLAEILVSIEQDKTPASCKKMLKNIEKLHESILKEKNTLRKKYFEK